MTHLYICNGAWEFRPFPYTPVVPKLLACAGDTTYSPVCDDNYDNKGPGSDKENYTMLI